MTINVNVEWESDGLRLPEGIEQALNDNSLVLFCGAGVSASAPSRLPGFRGLVEQVANDLGRPDLMPEDQNAPVQFDVIMGVLNEIQHDVHARVSAKIRTTVTPNSYHKDLLEVFRSKGQTPRIVTTNFDLLFEAAADQNEIKLPIFSAPALPLGNDFSGLVHLHGPVDPSAHERMIVTDSDFGRAYITEAWATQFLTRMFEKYTVLFIGYSADDTVMHYLARALPADGSQRYAFVADGSQGAMELKWSRLGVASLPYPRLEEDHHGSLQQFIGNWSKRLNASTVDRYDYVQAVAERRIPHDETSDAGLRWLLHDPELRRHFWNLANPKEWMDRLNDLGVLDILFVAVADPSETTTGWAQWLAKALLDGATEAFLAILSQHEGRFSKPLWFEVWSYLHNNYSPTTQHRQLLLMLTADHQVRDSYRLSALLRNLAETDPQAAEVVLQQLLTPTLQLRPQSKWFGVPGALDADLALPWKNSLVREAWPSIMPSLSDPDHLLSTALNLIRSVEATNSLFSGNEHHSSLSSTRQQIDGIEEYTRDDPYVLVVDIARDILREFVRAEGISRALWLFQSPSEMVQRLAIDALAEAKSSEADKIIQLLIAEKLVFAYPSKPEAFRAMKAMYVKASEQTKKQLIRHIQEASTLSDEHDIRDYERYNVLVWLSGTAEGADPIHAALAEAQEKNPLFAPREHPDLHSWVTTGVSDWDTGAQGEFREMSALEVVDTLAADSDIDSNFDGRNNLRELEDFLVHRGGQTDAVLEKLIAKSLSSSSVWKIVFRNRLIDRTGWSAEVLLSYLDKASVDIDEVAHSLSFSITHPETEDPTVFEDSVERSRLLLGLWKRTSVEDPETPPTDPTAAHSTARGTVAFAFVETVLRTIQNYPDAAPTEELFDSLRDLLNAQNECVGDPSPMMVARYAGYIAAIAPDWFDLNMRESLSHISSEPRSLSLWAGVLSRRSLPQELRPHVREAMRGGWARTATSLPGSTESFIDIHAALFVYDTAATNAEWADPFIAAAPVTMRVRWIRSVARHLEGAGEELQPLLFSHWQRRIDNQPPLTSPEQLALLEWVKLPNLDRDQAVALFVKGPSVGSTDEHGFEYYYMDDFSKENVTAYLLVTRHLLRGRATIPHFLKDMLQVLGAIGDSDWEIARQVWEGLLRVGYGPARDQLGIRY